MAPASGQKVVPAQLGFLAIYNPSLGTTDQTLGDQIVYYYSSEAKERRRSQGAPRDTGREDNNEQLRQIGLAQGMVEFGGTFSAGQSLDTVETEKSRIILHELEAGWWVLASIDLTILPIATNAFSNQNNQVEAQMEYSAREVKPAILLLSDILRAHSTFLLHHASSLSALFVRTRRSKFVGILGRYWDTFLSTWNVLMHGNPAISLYGGIKIAACGELGIGVGEEERGSGEREVLEGFVGRIGGLVDVIVSKFGDAVPLNHAKTNTGDQSQHEVVNSWLGTGLEPAAEDGVVFLGVGALSRKSIKDVSQWMEDLYRWRPYAYGIVDNPSSTRRTKTSMRKDTSKSKGASSEATKKTREVYGLKDPNRQSEQPSTVHVVPLTPDGATQLSTTESQSKQRRPPLRRGKSSFTSTDSESHKSSKLVQYFKLGYGTHWSLGGSGMSQSNKPLSPDLHVSSSNRLVGSVLEQNGGNDEHDGSPLRKKPLWEGKYLIGLKGNVDELEEQIIDSGGNTRPEEPGSDNERVLLRTLTVELEREEDARAEADISIDLRNTNTNALSSKQTSSEHTGTSNASFESQDRNKTKKLRVVVYIHRPFVFTLLFELRTEVLAMASLYRSLHYQIGPLIKPLSASTTFRAPKPDIYTETKNPIYDLVWNPKLLTTTSSIPNIPTLYHADTSVGEPSPPWSRIEALNTHMHIIYTYTATTASRSEIERTSKTSRGWWVVWTRIPDPEGSTAVPDSETMTAAQEIPRSAAGVNKGNSDSKYTSTFGTSTMSGPAHPLFEAGSAASLTFDKEIFLIRRASDNVAAKSAASRFGDASMSRAPESWTGSPGKLAQGIGVDTKRYIQALLNLT